MPYILDLTKGLGKHACIPVLITSLFSLLQSICSSVSQACTQTSNNNCATKEKKCYFPGKKNQVSFVSGENWTHVAFKWNWVLGNRDMKFPASPVKNKLSCSTGLYVMLIFSIFDTLDIGTWVELVVQRCFLFFCYLPSRQRLLWSGRWSFWCFDYIFFFAFLLNFTYKAHHR